MSVDEEEDLCSDSFSLQEVSSVWFVCLYRVERTLHVMVTGPIEIRDLAYISSFILLMMANW